MDRGAWRVTVYGVTKSWTQQRETNTHIETKAKNKTGVLLELSISENPWILVEKYCTNNLSAM